MKKELKDVVVSALWSAVFILGAIFFWYVLSGNPCDEFALISRGHTTDGLIIDTWQDAEDGEFRGTLWYHGAIYTYRLPDGREFTQRTSEMSGKWGSTELRDLAHPSPIEVEYLPDDPSVSRIKGYGCQSIFEWLWRRVGFGGLSLAMFLAPGLSSLAETIRDFRRYRQMQKG